MGRRVRKYTIQSSTFKIISDLRWGYTDADEVNAYSMVHLALDFALGYTNRSQLNSHTTPGNSGGAGVPPFTNPPLGQAPNGNESVPTSDAQAIPNGVLAVPARNWSCVIDPGGHRTSVTIDGVTTTYTRNAAGAVTQKAKSGQTVTYTQDQWGNTTQRVTTGTGAKTETFGVNYLGRTSSYTNTLTGANKSFPMWPSGEMFARTDNVAATNMIFATLDGETITEYDQAGAGAATLKNTFSGLGLNGKTTRIPASGGRAHFVGDHVNTLAMTLSDTGAPTETVVKGAYGEAIAGSTSESYSGIAQAMRIDGLDYMHHRMYDPEDGEFLANDPIVGNRAGMSYGYGGGDPLRLIDPLGLQNQPLQDEFVEKSRAKLAGLKLPSPKEQQDSFPLDTRPAEWLPIPPNRARLLMDMIDDASAGRTQENSILAPTKPARYWAVVEGILEDDLGPYNDYWAYAREKMSQATSTGSVIVGLTPGAAAGGKLLGNGLTGGRRILQTRLEIARITQMLARDGRSASTVQWLRQRGFVLDAAGNNGGEEVVHPNTTNYRELLGEGPEIDGMHLSRFPDAYRGGRLGTESTRFQINAIATEMESRGWRILWGGGRGAEEYIPGIGPGTKGSSYPDITAVKNGRILRLNTVDTVDGVTPTLRELDNASRIRLQTRGHLLLVPKTGE